MFESEDLGRQAQEAEETEVIHFMCHSGKHRND